MSLRLRAAYPCLAALLLTAPAAFADEAVNLLTDPFYFGLGGYSNSSDVEVSLNGEAGEQGTKLDWDRTLGDVDGTRFRIDGFWRFADRHKVRFMWFNNATENSKTIDRDIEWGGTVYPANARLEADFDFDVYELAYEYAFLRRENYEVTGTFGLHWTTLSLALKGEASIDGGEPVSGSIKREGSVDLPLPVIGVRGLWNLTHGFWLDASAQYFTMSFDNIDGDITDLRLAFLWQPKKWLGFGLGYNQFSVDVDVEKDSFDGNIDWTYEGPMFYYSVAF